MTKYGYGETSEYRDALAKKAQAWGLAGIDATLLKMAMAHPSYDPEGKFNNQRLEFLGDAVLGVALADHLFRTYPAFHEGELTRARAQLANESTLVTVAKALGLGEVLLLGRGEEKDGGRGRASSLADATEALIAAIYLDLGFDRAKAFVVEHFASLMADGDDAVVTDYKTMLQEYAQGLGSDNVTYGILQETGPPHQKTFRAGVYYKGELWGEGSGKTKKEAEKVAAKTAYLAMTARFGDHGQS